VAGVSNINLQEISIKTSGNQIFVINPFANSHINIQIVDLSGRIIGKYKIGRGRTVFNLPSGNQILLMVLDDQKGNRLTRKIYSSN